MVGTAALAGYLRKENRTKAENWMNPYTERLDNFVRLLLLYI